jgi:hypothetical protein
MTYRAPIGERVSKQERRVEKYKRRALPITNDRVLPITNVMDVRTFSASSA